MSAAFAAVLVAGGAGACGGEGGSGSGKGEPSGVTPASAVAEAAANSADIVSLHYRITGTVPGTGRLEADAFMRTDPPAMSMEMSTAGQDGDGPLPVRFVDEVMYVGEAVKGKRWFRADPAVWGGLTVDNDSYGVLPRQLESSPVVQSTLLTGSKDVRVVGTETVDGTRTTHYRGTVTSEGLRAARDAAPDEAARERLIESFDQFVGLRVPDTLTMDLWIDGDDRAKQFRWRTRIDGMRTGPDTSTGGGPLDLTVTFLDVDRPVTIEAPPAEDTAALPDDAQEG
ncbi:lipoprotein [Streptomyces atrovirens]|uniref:Lipoprotein n=1 Tax=Streptomyces atrovirens TaxID=285556 RepID=A0ABW0E235_9ACTN